VTNRIFKEFVTNGGYRKREFWKHEFLKEGTKLNWEEAMAEFVDSTGRPGPSTWVGGDYPPGKEGYPVSGVSWYEADAFAEYAHKNLPSILHWRAATGGGSDPVLNYSLSTVLIAQAPGYKAGHQLLKSSLFKKEKEKVVDFALVRQ